MTRWPNDGSNPIRILALFGAALILGGALFAPDQLWPAVLLCGIYLTGVGLAALFVIALHHLTGARWSEPLLPTAERVARVVPAGSALVVLALFAGWGSLYPDSHFEGFKGLWLSPAFLLGRALVINAIWIAFSLRMSKRRAAPFVVLFAITLSIASFDWIMALEPAWYSTILSVYHFSGAVVAGLAAIAVIGTLRGNLSPETRHDLGKLIFAFSTFWMYMWFSQAMLIWYSNLAEEAAYYTLRTAPAWLPLFIGNVVLNWGVPFIVLLPAAAKRNPKVLFRVALVLLAGHWLDLYLAIAPAVHPAGPPAGGLELGVTLGVASAAVLFMRVGGERVAA